MCVARRSAVCGGTSYMLILYFCMQVRLLSVCCQKIRSGWWSTLPVDAVFLYASEVSECVLPEDQQCVVKHLTC